MELSLSFNLAEELRITLPDTEAKITQFAEWNEKYEISKGTKFLSRFANTGPYVEMESNEVPKQKLQVIMPNVMISDGNENYIGLLGLEVLGVSIDSLKKMLIQEIPV